MGMMGVGLDRGGGRGSLEGEVEICGRKKLPEPATFDWLGLTLAKITTPKLHQVHHAVVQYRNPFPPHNFMFQAIGRWFSIASAAMFDIHYT